jgi:CheY-like chemotaxis protein
MQKKFYIPPQEKTHDISQSHDSFQSVLLLEDEDELTEVLKAFLESHQFRVTSVKNGVEGLKKIMNENFDLVLCDMMMPNLPGDMFYTAVERTKPQMCRRFIFMTGHKGDKKIDDFIRKVKGVMLWKPFQTHDLLQTIQVVLKKAAAPPAP